MQRCRAGNLPGEIAHLVYRRPISLSAGTALQERHPRHRKLHAARLYPKLRDVFFILAVSTLVVPPSTGFNIGTLAPFASASTTAVPTARRPRDVVVSHHDVCCLGPTTCGVARILPRLRRVSAGTKAPGCHSSTVVSSRFFSAAMCVSTFAAPIFTILRHVCAHGYSASVKKYTEDETGKS